MKIIIANSKSWFTLNKKIIKKNNIKFIQNKNELSLSYIKKFDPDFIFFPHWSWVVPNSIHKNYKCILFHVAPLPYGRGGSPLQNLILRGFKKAPVCAIKMEKVLDSGEIYSKQEIKLNGSLTDIFKRMNVAINKLIDNFLNNKKIKSVPQKGKIVTFKRLNTEDNEIKSGLNIKEIYDRIRMLDHSEYPKAFLFFGNYKIELYDAKLSSENLLCKANFLVKEINN